MNGLTTEEMIQISSGWTTPGTMRDAILGKPALAAMLPSVEAAHAGLSGVVPDVDAPARLKQLTITGAAGDLRHDNSMRGSHMLLTALSILTEDAEEEAELLALQNFVLPDGLQGTQKTYRGEAGAAELLTRRLVEEPARAEQLSAMVLPIGGGTPLRTFVDRWISEANRLGVIEDERVALVAATPTAKVVSPAAARAARTEWMNQVRALLAVATAIKLAPETHKTIFGGLEAAEDKASRRGRSPGGKAEKVEKVEKIDKEAAEKDDNA